MRKAVLFIAMSLDGYIADENGDIGFLNSVEMEGEDYGYSAFVATTDVVILGRKTWETVLSFNVAQPYEGKKVYVISGNKPSVEGNVEYYGDDLPDLVRKLKAEIGLDLFIDGGSQVIHTLLKERLIDRMIISIIPILLGDGIPLFRPGFPSQNLKLIKTGEFTSGLVQLEYEIISVD
ncbi:MAG: dihydrofolate reductase [Bacteroidales bacterium]|nr:dihydrofolate reductase [Bacteroidales bacterium]